MTRWNITTGRLLIAAVVVAGCASMALAGKGGGKGDGGGGGSGDAGYTIVDLRGPYHEADGLSQTSASHVADISDNGTIYVLGTFVDDAYGAITPWCVWTIDETGIDVEDITGLLDTPHDVNSTGIIAGEKGGRPALLLPSGQIAYLAVDGGVTGMNNPDEAGVFQVVGFTGTGPVPEFVLWDVMADGTALATTVLTDSQGRLFRADDINDGGVMGGTFWDDGSPLPSPAVGQFDGSGHLLLSPRANPNPAEIDGFWEFHIDDAGNLLGDGYKSGTTGGTYARAVLWPHAGGAIELHAAPGVIKAEGNGIAIVNGTMQAVGGANDGRDWYPYIYMNDVMTNLEPLSTGDQSWSNMFIAEGINTSGMICGQGRVGSRRNFESHGFLLIPK